jgi:IS30 family transposase
LLLFLNVGHQVTKSMALQKKPDIPIYALNERGMTQLGITVDIGFNPGAISRELGRNRGLRGYRFLPAHRFAVQRGLARKGVARVMTPCLIVWAEILLLDNQWSPEQISGALNREDGTKVSYESLYRHI